MATMVRSARYCAAVSLCLGLFSGAASAAGTFDVVHTFSGGTDGAAPTGHLVRAGDGNLYGTTGNVAAGAAQHGSVFKIASSGAFSTVYTFTGGADGSNPYGLTVGSDGNLYGVTAFGGQAPTGACSGPSGPEGCGTVFKITTAGAITTLYTFPGGSSGDTPNGVVQAGDGNFYGTTQAGGGAADGVLFRMTPTGTTTVLHAFSGPDGARPYGTGTLVVGTDGKLYGTTSAGGNATPCGQPVPGCGTVFQATLAGDLTTLHTFTGGVTDGGYPFGIMQASDGSFYGTTFDGGSFGKGTIFKLTLGSPSPSFTPIYAFHGTNDGSASTGVVQASDTVFFGTTTEGGTATTCGSAGCGTLFQLTPPGPSNATMVNVLHSFSSSVDGGDPFGLAFGSDGNLYGVTGFIGGTVGTGAPDGSVFRYAFASGGSSSSSGGGSSSSSSSGSSGASGSGSGGGGAAGFALLGGLATALGFRRKRKPEARSRPDDIAVHP